jgi:hypothetical protein
MASESARYAVAFASTDEPDLDAETTRLEDEPMTLDAIRDACRWYASSAGVRRRRERYRRDRAR